MQSGKLDDLCVVANAFLFLRGTKRAAAPAPDSRHCGLSREQPLRPSTSLRMATPAADAAARLLSNHCNPCGLSLESLLNVANKALASGGSLWLRCLRTRTASFIPVNQ